MYCTYYGKGFRNYNHSYYYSDLQNYYTKSQPRSWARAASRAPRTNRTLSGFHEGKICRRQHMYDDTISSQCIGIKNSRFPLTIRVDEYEVSFNESKIIEILVKLKLERKSSRVMRIPQLHLSDATTIFSYIFYGTELPAPEINERTMYCLLNNKFQDLLHGNKICRISACNRVLNILLLPPATLHRQLRSVSLEFKATE